VTDREHVRAVAEVATGVGITEGFSVASSLQIWIPWARIAKAQLPRAADARQALQDAHGHPYTTQQSEALNDEMEASLVAVCTATFAVEAIVDALGVIVIPAKEREKWKDPRKRPKASSGCGRPCMGRSRTRRWPIGSPTAGSP
jgi:hypothetical protein